MRIFGLIFGALLASTSLAAAQNCPGTFASCPPVAAGRINLGGPIVNQQGVPLNLPTALPQAGQVLTATDNAGHTAWTAGGITVPTSTLLGGSGGGFSQVNIGNNLSLTNGTLNATGGASPGGTTGQVQTNNGSGGLGALPTATTGASVVLQTTGAGTIDPSAVPIATTSILGGMKPDGVTASVNGAGVLSVIGGSATSVTIGTTTVGAGTPGSLLVNASGLVGNVTALPAANEPAHTGDVTNTAGSLALSLATVNGGPGSVGGASLIPVLTTNGKGLVTAQSTVAVVAPAGTLTGSALPAGITSAPGITSLGTLTALNVGGDFASLATTGPATLNTAAAQLAASYFLPFNSPSASIVVGERVTNAAIPANTYVLTVSGGTTPLTVTAPVTVTASGQLMPVSNSTGIVVGEMIQDTGNAFNQTAIVTGVTGANTSPTTLTSPTAASGASVIAVTSGGASCPLGSLLYDQTTPASTPAGNLVVWAATATQISIAANLSGAILSTDTVLCYPLVQFTNGGNPTNNIASGDAITFYPAVGISQLTTSAVASGAPVVFTPNTTTTNAAGVQSYGPINAGSQGIQINGQTVLATTSGLTYQNFPQDVTLIGIGAGANIPPGESLLTAGGYHSFNAYTGTNSESTGYGYFSGGHLVYGSQFDLFGINALGTCVYGCSGDRLFGTDAGRNSLNLQTSSGFGGAVFLNNNGSNNVAFGEGGVLGGTSSAGGATGIFNSAGGYGSMASKSMTTAADNSAWGALTLSSCVTCMNMDASGFQAGAAATSDTGDVLHGYQAGLHVNGGFGETLIGNQSGVAQVAAHLSTMLGSGTGTKATGNNLLILGANVANTTLVSGSLDILIGIGDSGGGGSDTPASNTSLYMNIGNALINDLHAPSVTGFGTSPTVGAQTSNGAFTVTVGTGGTASTGIIIFSNPAPHAWACDATDTTTTSSTVFTTRSVPDATHPTIWVDVTNYNTSAAAAAWAAGDVLAFKCNAY